MGSLIYKLERQVADSLYENNFKPALCFWVVTTGRSGTLKLSHLLNHINQIDSLHEPWPTLVYEGRLAIEGKALPLDSGVRMIHVARARFVEGSYMKDNAYADCSLFLSHLAEQIQSAFCSSRFIHLIRKPQDFVCSALARLWYHRQTTASYMWPLSPYENGERWQSLIWLWNEIHKKGLELEKKFGPYKMFRMYSEHLFEDPKAFQKLAVWMGLDQLKAEQMNGAILDAMHNESNRNAASDKPGWNPEWDSFLYDIAGETMEELYGHQK